MAELAEALAPPAAPEADAAESPQAQEPAGSVEQDQSDEEYDEESSAEEQSAEEDEQESSGDEDEKQPLSQRSAYASKHPLPQPTAPKRTRTNRFPKIPKSQRCGTCENCMNPQRKKACIVARQRMEEQMRLKEQQQGNGSSKGGGGGGKGGGKAAAAPGPDPADDPFTAALSKILSSTGGVQQERHVPLLLQLVRRARSKAHRTALLVVLQRSAGEVQRQAVAGRLLLELQSWLTDAVDEGDAKRAQNCLACLDKLPVTLAALQPPCELGKVVGKLRKHDSFGAAITDTAKRLVARWKGVVEAAQAKKAAGTTSGSSASATTAAKPAAAAAAKPMPAAAAKPAAAKPAAAGAAANERQASGSLAGMADGDLFKSADRQRAGVRDAVPAVKKTVIKTLPVEASRAKLSESAAADREGAGSKPGSSAAVAADVSKVSASPFASLGGLSGGVTMLGSGGSSGPLGGLSLSTVGPSSNSARDRALAAARRVPSPEPQPKKEKAKKVSWQKEDALVGVRWFLKADPPAAAQADADPAQLQRSTSDAAREPSPPGFESAAKKEHLSEAAALRQHRAEEDQERADLEERLAHMVATTAWLNPQPNDDLSDAQLAAMAAPPAYGEDSTEAPAAAARSQQVPRAQYASPAAIPETPGEPTSVADHGVVQHPATIPRIPLSLEEAAAMQPQQAQQAQQQQAQQQLPMQQPPMQQPGPQPMFRQQAPTAQQQQQQQQGQPAAALPDISAALAQLAASGVLSSVPGGGPPQQQQPQPMQQQQQQQQQPYPGPPGMPPQGPHMRPPPPPMGGMRPPPPGGPPQQGWQQPGPPRPQMQQPGPPRPPMQQPGPPRPPMQQPGPPMQGPPMQQQRGFGAPGPRPCRYFNTPRGCFQGDRCNFAHVPLGAENGRGPGPAAGMKRPAESDAGRQGKQPRWQ